MDDLDPSLTRAADLTVEPDSRACMFLDSASMRDAKRSAGFNARSLRSASGGPSAQEANIQFNRQAYAVASSGAPAAGGTTFKTSANGLVFTLTTAYPGVAVAVTCETSDYQWEIYVMDQTGRDNFSDLERLVSKMGCGKPGQPS